MRHNKSEKKGFYEIRRHGTEIQNNFPISAVLGNTIQHFMHWHDYVELLACVHGSVRVAVDSYVYTIGPGDYILINAGVYHELFEGEEGGMQAPSAGNQQPWEFYVVTNKEKIKELSMSHQYAGCAVGAPVVIVPVYRKNGLKFPPYAEIDLAIAQEHMWLMTESLGLGGVWMGIAPLRERMDKVKEILNLPDDVEAFSLFPLGYPDEEKEQQDRYDENRIHYVR